MTISIEKFNTLVELVKDIQHYWHYGEYQFGEDLIHIEIFKVKIIANLGHGNFDVVTIYTDSDYASFIDNNEGFNDNAYEWLIYRIDRFQKHYAKKKRNRKPRK